LPGSNVEKRPDRPGSTLDMAGPTFTSVLRYVRRLGDADADDGALLARFAARRDETAFAELVRRHGPMVLGVCRRVLRDAHAAEDAFQATFLLLVRKAASLRRPHLLGNWLYGVASRIALQARAAATRQRPVGRQVAGMPAAGPGG